MLLLDHVGRKSGHKRTTPLLYLVDGDNLVIVASRGGSDAMPAWWLNLQANPSTTVQVGRERRSVLARQATPRRSRRCGRGWSRCTATTRSTRRARRARFRSSFSAPPRKRRLERRDARPRARRAGRQCVTVQPAREMEAVRAGLSVPAEAAGSGRCPVCERRLRRTVQRAREPRATPICWRCGHTAHRRRAGPRAAGSSPRMRRHSRSGPRVNLAVTVCRRRRHGASLRAAAARAGEIRPVAASPSRRRW